MGMAWSVTGTPTNNVGGNRKAMVGCEEISGTSGKLTDGVKAAELGLYVATSDVVPAAGVQFIVAIDVPSCPLGVSVPVATMLLVWFRTVTVPEGAIDPPFAVTCASNDVVTLIPT